MALNQFDLNLFSHREVVQAFGEIPATIRWSVEDDRPSYLNFSPFSPEVVEAVSRILPEMNSWTDSAKMFGESNGNKIELWDDSIRVRIDMRWENQDFVEALVQLSVLLGCIIVCAEGGVVLEPNETSLVLQCRIPRRESLSRIQLRILRSVRERRSDRDTNFRISPGG
jgi:hypothetical protein